MVFQTETALFHFMVLFYLVIFVEDTYLKENREKENPSLHPNPVKFHFPIASFLLIVHNFAYDFLLLQSLFSFFPS